MLINVFVAGMFVASFLTIAQLNPGSTHVRWIAASYALGLLTPLADFLTPMVAVPEVCLIVSFLGVFAAMVVMGLALSMLYGRAPWWKAACAVALAGCVIRFAIWNAPREALWYQVAYQLPYTIAALLAAATVRRHGRGTGLDRAIAGLFFIIAVHFLLKPIPAVLLGAGTTTSDYAATTYAIISQVASGALLLAAGLLILINALQIVVVAGRSEALSDALTGLPNRRAMEIAFRNPMEKTDCPVGAIAILDVDHFKRINDSFGHDRGDAVLRALARCTENAIPPDASVFRIGGEEFVILLSARDDLDIERECEAVRQAIERLRVEAVGPVTVSIGATRLASDESPTYAMARADANLYRAKRGGAQSGRLRPCRESRGARTRRRRVNPLSSHRLAG